MKKIYESLKFKNSIYSFYQFNLRLRLEGQAKIILNFLNWILFLSYIFSQYLVLVY